MYLRTTQRRNKDGSVVRYLALAENVRHPEKGYVEAKVVHSFGRADQLDRAALERLVASIQRVLADAGSGPVTRDGTSLGRIALRRYAGAVVLVTHDPGAVTALHPERVILLPDGTEDHWSADYLDLVELA